MLALGVITLTVAKVFIIDTASISGIYRALSVIRLGVVLLGIGFLGTSVCYFRVLRPPARPRAANRAAGIALTAAGIAAGGPREYGPGGSQSHYLRCPIPILGLENTTFDLLI